MEKVESMGNLNAEKQRSRAGWRTVKLGEVATFQRGYDLPHSEMIAGSFPVVGSNGVIGTHSEFTTEPPVLTIGRSGCVGHPKFYKERCWAHNTTLYVKNFHGNDPCFVYYLLHVLHLDSYGGGSAVPTLNRNHIHSLEITLPPLPVQRRIAAVLGALDDKIELNRKMNANLEAQAQALYKSWFVDFEPWGGKMPSGWKKIKLTEIAEFYPGYSYKGNELQSSNVAMATIKNYERNGGFKLDGFKEITPSSKLKNEHEVHVYDTLVAHTDMTQNADVIGNAEIVLSNGGYDKLIMSMDLVKVLPKNGLSRFLIAALLKNCDFKSHCLGYVNGTTVLHMSKKALPEYELYFPNDVSMLEPISKCFESIFRMMSKSLEESRKLAELRDALLPKLMSGELEVAE